MCFNKETSLVAFLFGFAVSIKMFLSKEQFLGVMMLMVTLMQFLEFFIWLALGLENKKLCLDINIVFSFLICVVIILQPLLMTHYANEDSKIDVPPEAKVGVWTVLGLCTFFFVVYYLYTMCKYGPTLMVTQPNSKTCRLQWGFNQEGFKSIAFTAPIWIGFLVGYSYSLIITKNTDILILIAISLALACLYSWHYGADVPKTFESFWCFMCNIIAAYIIIIRIPNAKIKKNVMDLKLIPYKNEDS